MSDVIAIIPARAGSKGVSDKNIRSLAGKPLIAYSIQAAVLAENIDRVIVSTDSENYATIAKEYGAEIPYRTNSSYYRRCRTLRKRTCIDSS